MCICESMYFKTKKKKDYNEKKQYSFLTLRQTFLNQVALDFFVFLIVKNKDGW